MTLPTKSRLVLAFAGTGLCLAGGILLARAGWLAIAMDLGAVWASTIVGGTLAIVGLLAMLTARRDTPPARAPLSPQSALVGAFFEGLAAGRETTSRRR